MAIPKGITQEDVEQAIHDYDAGVPRPYGPSTRYDLVLEDGRRYPPKAIVGLAARRLNEGVPLDPDSQFGGGEGRSAANRVLRDLGYSVVAKGEAAPAPSNRPSGRRDWDATEIDVIVYAYFNLLHRDLIGEHFVKRDIVRGLETRLPRRTRGSIEYKFENISAVLEEEGLAFLRGYVPQHNYQRALKVAVLAELDTGERSRLEAALATPPASPPEAGSLDDLEVAPPKPRRTGRSRGGHTNSTGGWRRASSDASSKALGDAGEAWVVEVEKRSLSETGRPDLAARVEWVAQTRGDGLGFDVLSFDKDGSERWVEVKTTNAGATTPFFLSPHELAVWRAEPMRYELRRVFAFRGNRRFYRLRGDPDEVAELEVASWQARPR